MKHFGVIAWIMSDLLPTAFAPGFDIVFVYYNETRFLLIGVGVKLTHLPKYGS